MALKSMPKTTTTTTQNPPLPKELLSRISWTFRGDKYESKDEFDKAVIERQVEVNRRDDGSFQVTPHPTLNGWKADEVLLPSWVTAVSITYRGPHPTISTEYDDKTVMLSQDSNTNNGGWTALELLYQLHNAIIDDMNQLDHAFFEGLELATTTPDETADDKTAARYWLHCGS